MRLLGCAQPWEFRYRLPILIVSQPIFALIVYWSSNRHGIWYAPEIPTLAAVTGLAIAVLGASIRVWSASVLSAGIMGSKNPETGTLVTSGPFGIVRNPLYVGTMLIFAGYGLCFGWIEGTLFLVFHAIRYVRMVRFEESQFHHSQNSHFQTYMQQVPRFLPRRIPVSNFIGPVCTLESFLGNALFVSIPVGLSVSLWSGSLSWIVPAEIIGGFVMLLYFAISKPQINKVTDPKPSLS